VKFLILLFALCVSASAADSAKRWDESGQLIYWQNNTGTWLLSVFCDDLTQCDHKIGDLVAFDSHADAEMWIDNYYELGATVLIAPDGTVLGCSFEYLDPDPDHEGQILTHRKHYECMTKQEYNEKYCVDGCLEFN
jgi:hypothetical protein